MRKNRILLSALLIVAVVGLLAPVASADDVGRKLLRGFLNTTTGWVELPYQVIHQSSDDAFRGMTYGFIDGLARGGQRTLYGVWDMVTFPIPPHDKPLMEPETMFGNDL